MVREGSNWLLGRGLLSSFLSFILLQRFITLFTSFFFPYWHHLFSLHFITTSSFLYFLMSHIHCFCSLPLLHFISSLLHFSITSLSLHQFLFHLTSSLLLHFTAYTLLLLFIFSLFASFFPLFRLTSSSIHFIHFTPFRAVFFMFSLHSYALSSFFQ